METEKKEPEPSKEESAKGEPPGDAKTNEPDEPPPKRQKIAAAATPLRLPGSVQLVFRQLDLFGRQ